MPWAMVHDPALAEAVQLLTMEGLKIREISQRLKLPMSTVGRYSAPKAAKRKVLAKPIRCSGCGSRISVIPCVACQALAAPRPTARPDKERLDMGRIEPLEAISLELAEAEIDAYRQIMETRPR